MTFNFYVKRNNIFLCCSVCHNIWMIVASFDHIFWWCANLEWISYHLINQTHIKNEIYTTITRYVINKKCRLLTTRNTINFFMASRRGKRFDLDGKTSNKSNKFSIFWSHSVAKLLLTISLNFEPYFDQLSTNASAEHDKFGLQPKSNTI